MKCFRVDQGKLSLGIGISLDGTRPTIKIGLGESYEQTDLEFCDELKAQLQDPERERTFHDRSTDLVACDIEDRGQLWLMPTTLATANDALVYITQKLYGRKNHALSIDFDFSANCQVLLRNSRIDSIRRYYHNVCGEGILVRMPSESWVSVRTEILTRNWSLLATVEKKTSRYRLVRSGDENPAISIG